MPTDAIVVGPLVLATLLGAVAADGVRINEVLYDPPGADGDAEFVELFHGGTAPASLDGLELWFVDGGDATDRRRVWTAPPGATIGPGGFFVVGEPDVAGADATTSLDLQNGPDALWLVRDGVTLDAVAWGDDAAPTGEGAAAPDVSGRSLGRVPDGRDTQDNAADFRALDAPTPGRVNLAEVSFVAAGATVDPPWRADAGPVVWTPRWVAAGWGARQSGDVSVGGDVQRVEAAAGDTVVVTVALDLPLGDHDLVYGAAGGVADTTRLRIGPAAVRLTEIQARPATGEPEWVEVTNVGASPVVLDGWSLGDDTTTRALGAVGAIGPGARWILTADVAAWSGVHDVDTTVLRPEGGWATFNDGSTGDAGPADVVRLVDAAGRLVDRATYRREDLGERGESLQRTDVVVDGAVRWMRAAGPPTPGAAHPSEGLVLGVDPLTVEPDPFSPDGDAVDDLLQVVLTGPGDDARASVFDLYGEVVCELEGALGPSRAHWQWDGTDERGRPVPVGAYVIVVRRESDGLVRRRTVGLGRR